MEAVDDISRQVQYGSEAGVTPGGKGRETEWEEGVNVCAAGRSSAARALRAHVTGATTVAVPHSHAICTTGRSRKLQPSPRSHSSSAPGCAGWEPSARTR